MDKRAREQQTMEEMIKIYCHGLHHTEKGTLCPVCTSLLQYTRERIARCPHMETKTFCAFARLIVTHRHDVKKFVPSCATAVRV